MKVKEECAHCLKPLKVKTTVEIKDQDKDKFLEFVELTTKAGYEGLIPPSKYPKTPLVIPAAGQNPCGLCKHGAENVGPSGCGRSKTCLAWQYYQINKLAVATKSDTMAALKEFACGAPNASWLAPSRKRTSARSVELPFVSKPKTSSAPVASSRKRANRKSKWRKS